MKYEQFRVDLTYPLLIAEARLGIVCCSYLDYDALTDSGDAAAFVRDVDSFDDLLKARIVSVTPAAKALGIAVSNTGQEALEKMQ